jgi:hypothetical protein
MGVILIQRRKLVYYHFDTFIVVVRYYPTYDKELYALIQSVKKWKYYLMGKEKIIYRDHQPLQYLQSQTKLQQSRHFRWMGFLQQLHFVIRYKKGIQNKVPNVLSRLFVNASIVLQHSSLAHESYIEQYARDEYFKDVYETIIHGTRVGNLDYHVHDKFLYHLW